MTTDKLPLAIGTILYRYIQCGGIHRYKIIGVRSYPEGVFYEAEDQECRHGFNCVVLIGGDCDKLRYIQMVNDDTEDSHEYWHTDNTLFRLHKEQAELDLIHKNISILDKNIRNDRDKLERQEKELVRYRELAEIAKTQLASYAKCER